jgi:hypothetical protein
MRRLPFRRARGRVTPVVALLAWAGVWGATRGAAAQPGSIELLVDCPLLDEGEHALFEARARAELAAEQELGKRGTLDVRCDKPSASAVVRWSPADGEPRQTSLALASDHVAAIDALLEALHAMVSAEEPPPPTAATVPPPPAAPPAVAPPQALPAPAAPSTPPLRSSPAPAPAASERPALPMWAAVSGADAERWQGALGGALGAHLGLRAPLGRAWSVVALAGPAFGLGSIAGLHAWRLRALARVDYHAARWLQLGVGASGRAIWVLAPSGESPSSRTGWVGGAIASARGVVAVGRGVALEAGPDLEVLGPPLAIDIGNVETFRWPTVIASASVDVTIW